MSGDNEDTKIEEPSVEDVIGSVVPDGPTEPAPAPAPEPEPESAPEPEPSQESSVDEPEPIPPTDNDKIIDLQHQLAEMKGRLDQSQLSIPKVEPEKQEPQEPWKPSFVPTQEQLDNLAVGDAGGTEVFAAMQESVVRDTANLIVPYIQKLMQPLQQANQQAEMSAHREAFMTQNPDLADWGNEASEEADRLMGEPGGLTKFNNYDEVYKEIAVRTNARKDKYETRLNKGKAHASESTSEDPPAPDSGRARKPVRTGKANEEDVIASVLNL